MSGQERRGGNHGTATIGIVGLGLIGGSLALALREAGFGAAFHAWDSDPAALRAGLEGGVIDSAEASLEALASCCDLIVLAAPTRACVDLLGRLLDRPGKLRCVTDAASVKGPLCEVAMKAGEAASRFVPAHPIAGSERSGVGAARADLFLGHRVIITPLADTDPEALELVRALWEATGALVSEMDVREHDAVLAATSHLPHVLAFALVDALAQSPTSDDIFRFAAGGFRDFTRIASSDPVMWRDISLANGPALLDALDGFADHLAKLRAAIEVGDGEALEAIYRAAKSARDAYLADLARPADADRAERGAALD
ncbi:MAG: prephenate dehydrogenase/arogenate dehydrogenase family protein [Halieaceae bacterium]|jgi:prephenate dehydrogenase|nr:prephenate dehydrogenase/arogenate dehydrogenase family protein [Halieaceae bacterium]